MDLTQDMAGFKAIDILLCVRIAGDNLLGIFAVNPTLNGIDSFFTGAKLNRLAHRDSKGSHLFHHIEFRLLRVMLRNIRNAQKIPRTVLIGNTVFLITGPTFVNYLF